jgi:flagellar biosynthetic protein FliR
MPAELALPAGTLFAFLLVLARIGGAFVFVPLPGMSAGPEPVRAFLAVAFTVALYPVWPAGMAAPSAPGLLLALAGEAAFGLTAGVAVAFLTETLLVAAQIFGLQAGYSYASTIDPATEADSNVLLVFAQLISGLLFFSLGLDREILRVFARSLAAFPPGIYAARLSSAEALIGLGAGMFSTGLRLAMPVVVLLMLVDIALALMGRLHQQLQLLTLAFPVKMLASLAFLAVISALFLPVYRGAAAGTVSTLFRLLSGAHGG